MEHDNFHQELDTLTIERECIIQWLSHNYYLL